MRFLQGFSYGEYSFDLYYANGRYHAFINKCSSQVKYTVSEFSSEQQARKWHSTASQEAMEQLENGVEPR